MVTGGETMLKRRIILLLVIGIFALSGCSIEEALEDLTTRDITLSQTVYDGSPQGTIGRAILAEDVSVAADSKTHTIKSDLMDIAENITCFIENMEPVEIVLNGKITNPSNSDVRVNLALVRSQNSLANQFDLGGIWIGAKSSKEIQQNLGLDLSVDVVKERLMEFFAEDTGDFMTSLLVKVEGKNGAGVMINWLDIDASPVYHSFRPLDGAIVSGISGNVKSINSVSITGNIENLGIDDVHFVMVIGETETGPDFENGLVCDGWIAPGQSAGAQSLLVEGGLARIKDALHNALDGVSLENNIYLMSEQDVVAEIDNLKIKSKVTVGL